MNTPEAGSAAGGTCQADDWVGTWRGWAIWGSALVLLLAGGQFAAARDWLWFAGLLIAGAGCVVNAARCGRRHCYLTGPAFLLGAAYAGLAGLGLAPMSGNVLVWGMAGVAALGCVSEHVLGRYAGRA
jgi:hypothetical protein